MMYPKRSFLVGLVFAASSNVLAQSTPPNLPGFLSAVQSMASVLEPTPSPSSKSSSSISSTSSSSIRSSSSTTDSPATSEAATSSSAPTAGIGNISSGIDPQTRNIILGVTIPIGLLLLAAIIVLLIVCCRRRRRRTRRVSSPESKFINNNNNNDWEHGNPAHHGYNSNSSLKTGPIHGDGYTALHDPGVLMSASHKPNPVISEHPAYRHSSENTNIQNPFTPTPPISRKPVPNRDSTGSNISAISGPHHNNHHAGMATGGILGAGALTAVLSHNHNDRRRLSQSPHRIEPWHQPLGSHPQDSSVYATAGPTAYHRGNDQKRSPIPFSPDDVGSTHRSSRRFSQAASESPFADSQVPTTYDNDTIIAPTKSQRQSLQSRNSNFGNGRDISRGPSRSPKRHSLTGGGEMWQADTITPPTLPNQNRYSNSDTLPGDSITPPANPTQNRSSNSEMRHINPVMSSALPSNRHITRSQRPHLYDSTLDSTTDSSSGESWESAQADLNPWQERDTGRYPRFNGASGNNTTPLMPPNAAWDDRKERRWSGDMFNNRMRGDKFAHNSQQPQRDSGLMEKRRLRFSDGHPEIYTEQGLVGRAL